ncbi:MAG TPA: DUF3037 domain-containing protein [Polyangia bacterium]|jgi:hypothetical protein|nr:DUF3037 domain-containing protein [Polyangia bacterium]
MPARSTFDWAVVRVVPRVERGEQMNAGVILYCKTIGFLGARVALDRARLHALDPAVDADAVERALALIPLVCAGDAAAGPIAKLSQSERFHWLTAPRSTITQPSAVHTGLCDDPEHALERLLQTMVLPLKS